MGKISIMFCKNSLLAKIVLIAVMLFPAMSFLQAGTLSAKTIKGVVVSASDDSPLIGASVKVVGKDLGVITDLDGNFAIEAENGQMLEVSYIGFITQQVKVSSDNMRVVLKEESNSLEGVVVIGYGVQKKKLVTGATTQLKGNDVSKLNTNNALQAMQGQAPGVNIISESGKPGSDMKVIIRGQGSNTSNKPLYIIDGIPGDITNINPSDIESIDVLKDAASAAIYGAQAANGVVLVTTRGGSEGKTQVTFDAYMGWQNPIRKIDMCDANEYMTLMDEQNLNSGKGLNDWKSYTSIYDANGKLNNTNWMDLMFKDNAKQQSYTLGVSGGTSNSTYSISLGYYDQEGIIGGRQASNYERYNFRANMEQKLYGDFLKIGENVSMAYVKNTDMGTGNMYNNNLRGAYSTSPLQQLYLQEGRPDLNNGYSYSIATDWYQYDGNPIASMYRNRNNNDKQNWVANVYAEIQPIKNLRIRTQIGFDHNSTDNRRYTPNFVSTPNSKLETGPGIFQSMFKGWTLTWTNTASYNWNLNEDHDFNAMIGMESERNKGMNMNANNVLLDIYDSWETAYLTNSKNTSAASAFGYPSNDYRRVSYFGRIGWSYKDTYMANATLRADGSSRFAKGHRYGYFPSVSAGWVITNESWMKNALQYMDFLKIRASWGQVGNNSIKEWLYLANVTLLSAGYNFGTGNGSQANSPGAYSQRLGNENLKWETSEQTDLGFDARFLQGRLNVNFDWYWKKTKDWIVQAPVIATAGADAPYINGGDVTNKGIELGATWNDHFGEFNYNIGANMAYNKNVVGNIPTADGMIHGTTNIMFNNQTEFYRCSNGHAMGYFWGYKTDGLFQTQDEINQWVAAGNGILANTAPGDIKVIDLDHNGVIDNNDKVDLGNGIPKWNFGFSAGCNYKNFDFNIVFSGAAGFKIANGGYRNWGNSSQSNYTTYFLGRWTGAGTSNSTPRLTADDHNWTSFSDIYLQDGDYLRIANVTLGYDFAKLIDFKYLGQARLYFQVQNLCTFTKYNGMDPEVGFGQDAWMSGIDTGSYPHSRTFLVGVNLKF